MTSSADVVVAPLARTRMFEPHALRAEIERELGAGARLVTFFGRPDGAGAIVTAVLERARDSLVLRAKLAPNDAWHSLTEALPALHVFERELHEQLGIEVRGHPWLKPVRFEHARTGASLPAAPAPYPFYAIAGKEVHEVAVGPIHAGVIEPGSFRFMCHGEMVHHLEIHHGYQHRGVEPLLLRRDARALGPLVETIAGDASIAHTWAYAAAIEALGEHAVRPEVDRARAILLELERIAMHLATLSGLAADAGFLQGASTYGRLRTVAINAMMRACGSRFGRSAVRPGGSGAALARAELARALDVLGTDGAIIEERFSTSWTVGHRLRGAGVLATDLARRVGVVGVAARASGLETDVRAASPGLYARHPVRVVVDPDGDVAARARVRLGELRASREWIAANIEADASDLTPVREKIGALAAATLVVARVESSRGEVVHALETGPTGALLHYKVQDPSLRNWLGLALAVRDNEISDFPICNKSFDLSYCGSDL